jgi:DNA (cytosine-5)-methyltransferase 1
MLDLLRLPYIIENVEQSSVRHDLKLCGEMFGLRVLKHRNFEISGFTVPQPDHQPHRGRAAGWRHGSKPAEPYYVSVYGTGGSRGTIEDWREAMRMPWAGKKRELSEAIPPVYTEFIGKHLMKHLTQTNQSV